MSILNKEISSTHIVEWKSKNVLENYGSKTWSLANSFIWTLVGAAGRENLRELHEQSTVSAHACVYAVRDGMLLNAWLT